jgi:hypothetical protein
LRPFELIESQLLFELFRILGILLALPLELLAVRFATALTILQCSFLHLLPLVSPSLLTLEFILLFLFLLFGTALAQNVLEAAGKGNVCQQTKY